MKQSRKRKQIGKSMKKITNFANLFDSDFGDLNSESRKAVEEEKRKSKSQKR